MTKNQKPILAAFNRLREFVSPELLNVNSLILSAADSYSELIPTITTHLTASGGKRLRPMLTLAVAKIVGIQNTAHIKLATAVEYIHTATLLHDDVIDESSLRRGKETANNLWGNKASILVGDYLLSQSFKLMVETGSLAALGMLANTASTITEAEIWQLELIGKIDISLEEYIKLVTGKTAALFAASCAVSAVAMNLPKSITDSLYAYGLNLGICFQIVDDILDYFSNSEDFGKNIGNDLLEGKITIPLIYAYQLGSSEERQFIAMLLTNANPSEHELDQLYALFNKCNARGCALKVAVEYAEKGVKCLESVGVLYDIALLNEVILEQPTRVD